MVDPYPDYIMKRVRRVEETREDRVDKNFERITEEESKELLNRYHPDYKKENKRRLLIGLNKGDLVPIEVANLLEAYPLLDPKEVDLDKADFAVDILVIGSGGAGLSASLWANNSGVPMENILMATKLRMGDSNSKMSQGGIQGADNENDSPLLHFLDVMD